MFETEFCGKRVRIIPYEDKNWVLAADIAQMQGYKPDVYETLDHTEYPGAEFFHHGHMECDYPGLKLFFSPEMAFTYLDNDYPQAEAFQLWLDALVLIDDPSTETSMLVRNTPLRLAARASGAW
ncbi:hypothetical protein [Rhizobium sp. Root483D2]|uniref:hypothetical protein n=1 Tax=Rhizobium sp. Root483D2 TaxID=1736545 RepID=UPI0007159B86|nr:hypothetical protein [Rhizobium sp. Root483D2]KQY25934.1 hypothetical protein ASD32_25985 [Rhizobium sp. Root483D2]